MSEYIVVAIPKGVSLDAWRSNEPFTEVIHGTSVEDVSKIFFWVRHRNDFKIAAIISKEDLQIVKEKTFNA